MPVRTNLTGPHPTGFSTNFIMYQQGFTANISCEEQDFMKNHSLLPLPDYGVNLWAWAAQCGSDRYNGTYFTSNNNDSVVSLYCINNTTRSYSVLLQGFGAYDFIPATNCTVIPIITEVQADYSSVFTNVIQIGAASDGFSAGLYAIQSFCRHVTDSQNYHTNMFGDAISTLSSTPSGEPSALNPVLAAYIKGVVELSGTALRTVFSEQNNTVFTSGQNEITPEMMKSTNGTFRTETMGWASYPISVAVLLVISITVITLTSIILLSISLVKMAGHRSGTEHFDPTDPFHLVVASSAGGLDDAFPGSGKDVTKYGDAVTVSLGVTHGQRFAFMKGKSLGHEDYHPLPYIREE